MFESWSGRHFRKVARALRTHLEPPVTHPGHNFYGAIQGTRFSIAKAARVLQEDAQKRRLRCLAVDTEQHGDSPAKILVKRAEEHEYKGDQYDVQYHASAREYRQGFCRDHDHIHPGRHGMQDDTPQGRDEGRQSGTDGERYTMGANPH